MTRRVDENESTSALVAVEKRLSLLMRRWLLAIMAMTLSITVGMGAALYTIDREGDRRDDDNFVALCNFVKDFAGQRSTTAAVNAGVFTSAARLMDNIVTTAPENVGVFTKLSNQFRRAGVEEKREAVVTRRFANKLCEELAPH